VKVYISREIVRKLRISKDWTQERLAEISGVHSRTIQRVESDCLASMQPINALTKDFEVETETLRQRGIDDSGRQIPARKNELSFNDLNTRLCNEKQQLKELAKQAERIGNWLSYRWAGWPILFIGGYLIVSALLLTQSNLNRTVILNVLLPSATIGLLLMIIGKFFVHLSNRASNEKIALARLLTTEKGLANIHFRLGK
jgi:transcriptional regulator with XRE-family HTH domain